MVVVVDFPPISVFSSLKALSSLMWTSITHKNTMFIFLHQPFIRFSLPLEKRHEVLRVFGQVVVKNSRFAFLL